MQNSINFFHDENKILHAYDNTFFVKSENTWKEVNNKTIFKGNTDPSSILGKDGDYYIKYDEIYNLLLSSEIFNKNGWVVDNVSFIKMIDSFPYSNYQKMIPNKNNSLHNISYQWLASKKSLYWCFSIYVSPQEYNDFQITLSDSSEKYGLKGIFSRKFINKKYVMETTIKTFGTIPSDDMVYDDDCIGVEQLKSNFYRVYLSCKFNKTQNLKLKFSILKNDNNVLKEKFANQTTNTGLIINSAQLTNTKLPTEYIVCNGSNSFYQKLNKIYLKNGQWNALNSYNSIYYENDYPKDSFGNNDDIYIHNPIIKIGELVRFGKNPKFYGWSNDNNKYYTVNEKPKKNDLVYAYGDVINSIGIVTNVNKDVLGKYVTLSIGNESIKAYRDSLSDTRFLKGSENIGIMFWNKEDGTYGYVGGDGKIHNLKYSKSSLYDKKAIIDALTFSTNLFMQTWDTKYTVQPRSFEYGFNTGGHGNFLDYNRLRFYY